MQTRRFSLYLFIVVFLSLSALSTADASPFSHYDTATLSFSNDSGSVRAELTAWIAETPTKRYLGLSISDTLPRNRGMLFTYDQSDTRTFTMRNMNYGIDLCFIDSEGVVREIRSMEAPTGNTAPTTTARGEWILETNLGWVQRNGIEIGDRIKISSN